MSISFCTLSKGRINQIKKTLMRNLQSLTGELKGSDIVLLDFQSEDGLRDYILSNFGAALNAGLLKYFFLESEHEFSIPFGKNIAHRLANNDILVNLDGDNYIESARCKSASLEDGQICVMPDYPEEYGTDGRIGMTKKSFFDLRGYDEDYFGCAVHDTDLIKRAIGSDFKVIVESSIKHRPVTNSDSDTSSNLPEDYSYYLKKNTELLKDKHAVGIPIVNPTGFVEVTVSNHLGERIVLSNNLEILE